MTLNTLTGPLATEFVRAVRSNTAPQRFLGYMNLRDDNGNSLLHYTVQMGSKRATAYLLQYSPPLAINKSGCCPLDVAFKLRRWELVELLANYLIQVNDRQRRPVLSQALYHAVLEGRNDIVPSLIKAGATLGYVENTACYNALHQAIRLNNLEAVRMLYTTFPNMKISDKFLQQYASKECCQLLPATKVSEQPAANVKQNPKRSRKEATQPTLERGNGLFDEIARMLNVSSGTEYIAGSIPKFPF